MPPPIPGIMPPVMPGIIPPVIPPVMPGIVLFALFCVLFAMFPVAVLLAPVFMVVMLSEFIAGLALLASSSSSVMSMRKNLM